MRNDELKHHGVHGQKWGVKNGPPYPIEKGGKNSAKSKFSFRKKTKVEENKKPKKTVSSMSDAELKDAISRMELEKKYKQLVKEMSPQKTNKGKKFVMDVVEKSGKNIATQLTTYGMGVAVNKLLGADVVNPKKGQKDK